MSESIHAIIKIRDKYEIGLLTSHAYKCSYPLCSPNLYSLELHKISFSLFWFKNLQLKLCMHLLALTMHIVVFYTVMFHCVTL